MLLIFIYILMFEASLSTFLLVIHHDEEDQYTKQTDQSHLT